MRKKRKRLPLFLSFLLPFSIYLMHAVCRAYAMCVMNTHSYISILLLLVCLYCYIFLQE
ncbi:hypothetical protein F5H01DRAFT_349438 [Linnemannia elongata]|nr:hypothetical protein F5H01DRAFT_349438 [Linnemannia elongata]